MKRLSIFALVLISVICLQCEKTDNVVLPTECNELFTNIESTTVVFLPTAFSPNYDGRNDLYRAGGNLQHTDNFKLSVYKLNGDLVFETSNFLQGWDGKDATGKIPSDELYRVNIQLTNDQYKIVSACTHVYLLQGASCVHFRNANPDQIFFEDQFDPFTGDHPFVTGENLCP